MKILRTFNAFNRENESTNDVMYTNIEFKNRDVRYLDHTTLKTLSFTITDQTGNMLYVANSANKTLLTLEFFK